MAFTTDTAKEIGSKGGKQSKKRDVVTQHIIAALTEIDPATQTSKAHQLAQKLVDLAVAGDMQATKEVIDRVEGKPAQSVDLKHDIDITSLSAPLSALTSFFAETDAGFAGLPGPNLVPN